MKKTREEEIEAILKMAVNRLHNQGGNISAITHQQNMEVAERAEAALARPPWEMTAASVDKMSLAHQNSRLRFACRLAKEAIQQATMADDGLDGSDGEHVTGVIDDVLTLRPVESAQQIMDLEELYGASDHLLHWIQAPRSRPPTSVSGGHDCQWCGDCVQKVQKRFGKAMAKVQAWRGRT